MESLQARFQDDSEAYARARTDYLRAIELDPENPRPYFDYARTIVWDDPELASSLHQRTAELNPLWELALASSVNQITRRESYEVRRKRLRLLAAQSVDPNTSILNLPMAFLEEKWGHLDEALIYLRPMVQAEFSPEFSKALWSVYMSLGDRAAAREVLAHRGNELSEVLRQAAALNVDNRLNDAYATLESHRLDFPHSRVLDLPAARQALITGHPETALAILEQRLPDLASGLRAVSARNVIPALDLAAAYSQTGQDSAANQLLERIAAFLDGPDYAVPADVHFFPRPGACAGRRAGPGVGRAGASVRRRIPTDLGAGSESAAPALCRFHRHGPGFRVIAPGSTLQKMARTDKRRQRSSARAASCTRSCHPPLELPSVIPWANQLRSRRHSDSAFSS